MDNSKRAAVAAVFLGGLLLTVTAASFISSANEVNRIRGDFCSYVTEVRHVTLELPQVAARVQAERNDIALSQRLGC